jgi:hypothetical protein
MKIIHLLKWVRQGLKKRLQPAIGMVAGLVVHSTERQESKILWLAGLLGGLAVEMA